MQTADEFSIWRLALPNEAIPSSQQRVVGEFLLHSALRTGFKLCADRVFVIISLPVLHVLSLVLPCRQCTVAVD
jgi:hypothetical protein